MNVNTFFDSRSKIIRHAYNAVGRDICLDMLFKKKHNYLNNPDLESIVNDGEYDVYWDVVEFDKGFPQKEKQKLPGQLFQ